MRTKRLAAAGAAVLAAPQAQRQPGGIDILFANRACSRTLCDLGFFRKQTQSNTNKQAFGAAKVVTAQASFPTLLSVVEQCTHIPTVVGMLPTRSTASTMVPRFSSVFRPLALQHHGITSRGFFTPAHLPPVGLSESFGPEVSGIGDTPTGHVSVSSVS